MLRFDWNPAKARLNLLKHGISFEEAETVFLDTYAILFDDPRHSDAEERFYIIGLSRSSRVCIVSHCYRENNGKDEIVRIISARKATKREADVYNRQER